MNGTVTTDTEVVVRVGLANFHPTRGRITLDLTANRSTVAQQTVTVGIDEQRTVYVRTIPRVPGRYEMRLNGVSVGSLTVVSPDTGAQTPTAERSAEASPDTVIPTLVPTAANWEPPAEGSEARSSPPTGTRTGAGAGLETGVGTEMGAVSAGPDGPTGTEAIVAVAMSLMLLYGVGTAVYVLRE